eukprot:TRINITY_DN3120_c0_g1_i1.p1 TRINITY_DN3120_c0_g1~~TRINITY_DN3120_c0_g1_i1.p1  ORF type:complete len:347 (-),score=29.35 TRINITY_DN3120_c0_g1_i1:996-1961(-)
MNHTRRQTPYKQLQRICYEINKCSPVQIQVNDEIFKNVQKHAHNVQELKPSGPRLGDMGIDQSQQGIMCAQMASDGTVILKVSLLAAGFVVGTRGESIQRICSKSGARSKSWFTKFGQESLRVFYIEGTTQAVLEAVTIIVAAINKYKQLIEGQYQDKVVSEKQVVKGITFEYKPPPIHTIPVAARTIRFGGSKPSVYGRQKAAKQARQAAKREKQLAQVLQVDTCKVEIQTQNNSGKQENHVSSEESDDAETGSSLGQDEVAQQEAVSEQMSTPFQTTDTIPPEGTSPPHPYYPHHLAFPNLSGSPPHPPHPTAIPTPLL